MAESAPGDRWLAVCGPPRPPAEVEHRLLDLARRAGGAVVELVTHVVRAPEGNHHAGSLRVRGPAGVADAVADRAGPDEAVVRTDGADEVQLGGGPGHLDHAVAALRAHRGRASGRLVRFPGQAGLPAVLPLRELAGRCAVEAVDLLGVADAPGLLLRTRGHVRPEFRDGVVVLAVTARADGEVCPFEGPRPRACCSDH